MGVGGGRGSGGSGQVAPNCDTCGVGSQAFAFGHVDRVGSDLVQSCVGEMDHTTGAQERIGRKSAGEAGRGACGQHVRRTGDVVPHGDGRVMAEAPADRI